MLAFRGTARHVLCDEPFIQREHRDRADTDARAVRDRLAVDTKTLHLPDMGNLMIAAAGGPRIAVGLHCEAGDQQAVDEAAQRLGAPRADALVPGEPPLDVVLHQRERGTIDRILAERVQSAPATSLPERSP